MLDRSGGVEGRMLWWLQLLQEWQEGRQFQLARMMNGSGFLPQRVLGAQVEASSYGNP
jgi:hypothetical protein